MKQPVFVSALAAGQVLDLARVTDALRRTYEAQPPEDEAAGRTIVGGPGGTRVRALVAVLPDGEILGTKVHVQPGAGGSRFLISLFSQVTGALLGLLDGRAITELRTGATSALALAALAPPGELDLAVLGSGREARSHVRAAAVVRPLGSVSVYSPTRERRERFASEMRDELGIEIVACDSAEEAISGSNTVVAAARSHGEVPIFAPAALRDRATVVSIGSTVPDQRELDERVLERAAMIIADEPHELLQRSGDCIAAADAGIELAGKTHSLAQLLQRRLPVPIDHDAVNVFKSIGSALQDVTVAACVLRAASDAGLAVPLPIDLSPKEKRG